MPILKINSDFTIREVDLNSQQKFKAISGENLDVSICYPEITGVNVDLTDQTYSKVDCQNDCELDKTLHILLYIGDNIEVKESDC